MADSPRPAPFRVVASRVVGPQALEASPFRACRAPTLAFDGLSMSGEALLAFPVPGLDWL
jgi:hypothetical protein